jgi:dipeptidyl aminopeptidase/acylaminoacyl peptidase
LKKIIAGFVFFILVVGTAIVSVSYHFANELTHNPVEKRAHFYEEFPNLRPAVIFKDYDLKTYEKVTLTTEDGLKIIALYIPSENGAAIIVQHGYKMAYTEMIPIATTLTQRGYGAILPTLRAHGDSEGELISFGLYELQDLEAAYQYLLTRSEIDPERIGMFGNSMGGALAILYAAKNPAIKAVVTQSPYDSLNNTIGVSVKKFTGLPAFPFAPIILFIVEQQLTFNAETVAPINYIDQLTPRPILILVS